MSDMEAKLTELRQKVDELQETERTLRAWLQQARDERDGVRTPEGVTVHRYLDLSTCHLDEATARAMADGWSIPETDEEVTPFSYQAITSSDDGEQYGHIAAVLPVDEESERHWPQCLRDVWTLARAVGADYVRFDRDASTAAGLPVYEW